VSQKVPRAYYNEFDTYAAAWLRNLIAAGLIPDGDVDERSITDVRAEDLRGYTQCHFFAGIGGWALAARLAGWPDDREIWTGSCPCQPFSVAGKGAGVDDPRHLWPHFFRLIRACRPAVVMGEQVAGAAGYGWLDGVVADLASEGYAGRGVDIPACAVDAPHIRSRLYWVASDLGHASSNGRVEDDRPVYGEEVGRCGRHGSAGTSEPDGDLGMADADRAAIRIEPGRLGGTGGAGVPFDRRDSEADGMAHPDSGVGGWRADEPQRRPEGRDADRRAGAADVAHHHHVGRENERLAGLRRAELHDADGRGQRNGTFWSDAIWLTGADGKARRAQPGLPLLAHGVPARVGRLRAYGNAIVPQLAAEVIGAYLDAEHIDSLLG